MPLLEEGVGILWNHEICVVYGLSDLLKAPLIYDVIESYEGAFWGYNGILQKEFPDRVANVTLHDEMTTNHAEVLTK